MRMLWDIEYAERMWSSATVSPSVGLLAFGEIGVSALVWCSEDTPCFVPRMRKSRRSKRRTLPQLNRSAGTSECDDC